ncbi:MAG: transporter substrate-binding domain-containing protein [Muribaculaceae bacterium]
MNRLPSIIIILIAFLAIFTVACKHNAKKASDSDLYYHSLPDTLRIGTLYSPTSYFMYKGETMGYEYDLISKFAKDKNIALNFVVAQNMASMIELLDSGLIDVIAYEIPITAEYKNKVLHCGTENITHQVLIQPKAHKKGDTTITDVTQLVGKDVYVEKDSKYESRLKNLDGELGGGIKMHAINQDTLISEDLIEMVAEGSISLTIVDSDIAKLNKTYYNNIDISLEVSFPQRASWAVSKGNAWLADSIDAWSELAQNKASSKELLKRYFELSKYATSNVTFDLKNGKISQFDHLFKKYAKTIGWDWRLLAAQAYSESNFDSTVVSWAGARGIMQLMPGTARAYGLGQDKITNPELNIKAAVACIKDLDKSLSKIVPNREERLKFIIAAYNSGIGHVYDAIALAKKHGKNPQIWDGNVGETILMKSNPEYFNDEVCRFGYFKGKETIAYVAKVKNFYKLYKIKIRE